MKIKDITKECIIKKKFHPQLGEYNALIYKGVILWSIHYSSIEEVPPNMSITLDEYREDDFVEYTILGKTPVFFDDSNYDISTYGRWHKLEDALEWIDNPYPLY